MHIKVYFNEKPLYLADALGDELSELTHHDDTVVVDELSAPAINAMIHEMRQAQIRAGILVHHDLEALQKAFNKKFMIIQAAGGLVRNEAGEFLFIFRKNKWDLPKGKLEAGEDVALCAVRETEEETGLQHVELLEPLLVTWHTYEESGHHILKETHWYRMQVRGKQTLVPQTEEQITEIRWVMPSQFDQVLANTYPLIRDVLRSSGAE